MTNSLISPIDKFEKHFIVDKILLNQTIANIYYSLYHPDSTFIINLLKEGNNTEINISQLELNPPNNHNTFPLYTRYTNTYIHPTGLKIPFAPQTVNIEDEFIICIESERRLIVQVTNKLSGYMMLDSFISRTLYIYETEGRNIKLNVRYGMEFIKTTLFQKAIAMSAYKENEKNLNEVIVKAIEKELSIKEVKWEDVDKEKEEKKIEIKVLNEGIQNYQEKDNEEEEFEMTDTLFYIIQAKSLEYWNYSLFY